MNAQRATIAAIVDGDVALMELIRTWTDDEFALATADGPLQLDAAALARVLAQFQRGELTERQAQAWASFVMHGVLAGVPDRALDSLTIDYDPTREDEVATAVMRLDELGDLIDGEFRPGEIDQLIAALTH